MYSFEYDDELPALISICWGTDGPRYDFEQEGPHAARVASRAKALGRRAIYIQAIDPEVPNADAKLRKEIADRANSHVAPFDYAMISESAIFRGIVTVVMWFKPPQNGHASSVHADEGSALRWVESQRGHSLPQLHEMYARVRRQVREAKRGAGKRSA